MSFEGTTYRLCENGHLTNDNVYHGTTSCPHCEKAFEIEMLVDETNGSPYRVEGFFTQCSPAYIERESCVDGDGTEYYQEYVIKQSTYKWVDYDHPTNDSDFVKNRLNPVYLDTNNVAT